MLVIMDRDGVINHDSTEYIKSPKEWIAIPHSLNAITRLNHAGHQVVVATNQSGVGRGYYSMDTLNAIHQKMKNELSSIGGHLDGLYICPHKPDDLCRCRKPQPGMLLEIANDFNADLKETYFIGDSLRDIEAAQQVGALPVLVRTGKGEAMLKAHQAALQNVPVYADLSEVVGAIIGGNDVVSNSLLKGDILFCRIAALLFLMMMVRYRAIVVLFIDPSSNIYSLMVVGVFYLLNVISMVGLFIARQWGFISCYFSIPLSTLLFATSYFSFVTDWLPTEVLRYLVSFFKCFIFSRYCDLASKVKTVSSV